MDIYENIIIGNFLLGLGIAMGMRHSRIPIQPTAVNLLQQTPLDKSFADVLVSNSKIFRLIEFKRRANVSGKETAKREVILDVLKAQPGDLEALSRKIHWYVESEQNDMKLVTKVVPYLDFPTLYSTEERNDLPNFIENMAEEAISSAIEESEIDSCRFYMELLCRCSEKNEGINTSSSGALLIKTDQWGQLQYAVVNDIRELILPLKMRHMYSRERQIEKLAELQKQEILAVQRQSRGLSLGR